MVDYLEQVSSLAEKLKIDLPPGKGGEMSGPRPSDSAEGDISALLS